MLNGELGQHDALPHIVAAFENLGDEGREIDTADGSLAPLARGAGQPAPGGGTIGQTHRLHQCPVQAAVPDQLLLPLLVGQLLAELQRAAEVDE